MYIHMYVYMYTYMYTCMRIHMCIHLRICVIYERKAILMPSIIPFQIGVHSQHHSRILSLCELWAMYACIYVCMYVVIYTRNVVGQETLLLYFCKHTYMYTNSGITLVMRCIHT
jgi:hypothetical protein